MNKLIGKLTLENEFVNELCDEFRRVQVLLPFRLTILLLKEDCYEQYKKWEAIVKPEDDKKAAEWACCLK